MTIHLLLTAILAITLSGCRMFSRSTPAPKPPEAVAAVEAAAPQVAEPATTDQIASAPPAIDSKATVESHAPAKITSVDPQISLGWLQNGNVRFAKHRLRKDGQSAKDIARLSKGQHPHAIILSCSDSRVPPEIVFDQKLGEVFVIRTAGESLDHNVIASIEYAVAHLGPRFLLVMGHSSCGAIGAALDYPAGKDAGSASLNFLVADIQKRIKPGMSKDDATWSNARGIVEDLKARSPIIRNAVANGSLLIKDAVYNLESGIVKIE